MNAIGSSSVLPGLDPLHLGALELSFARRLRVVGEVGEFAHPAVEIREAHAQRVDVGMLLRQSLRDVFSVVPGESHAHSSSSGRLTMASCSAASMMRWAKGSV